MIYIERKGELKKILKIILILAILLCCILLFPQVRFLVIQIAERILGHDLPNHGKLIVALLKASLFAIFFFCVFFCLLIKSILNKLNKIINFQYFPRIMMLVLLSCVLISISIQAYFNVEYINFVLMLKTIGTFFMYLIVFSLTLILVFQKIKDWRSSFIVAFLVFGIYAWLLAEVLGFLKILTTSTIFCGWIIYITISILYFIKRYITNKIYLSMPNIFPSQWENIVIAVILSVTFFIAVAYPPNNWDSMAYHLPRIEHWLQNKSLNHYYTSDNRQVLSAPFAEILILHGRALSGDDFLANLVQWFSLLGAVVGITKIVGHLGMNRKMQITAALFFATVPMAVLQASTTQTDLVEAFCIICLVERFLSWRKTGLLFDSITFGLALGLSILTKGTAYPIALPFVLCFTIITIKHFRKRFAGACLAAILCFTVNLPHYTRNYLEFRNPLGAHAGTVSNFSVKSFLITFFENIQVNIPLPLPFGPKHFIMIKINESFDNMWDTLKVDNTIFPIGRPRVESIIDLVIFHEDLVKNTLHIILVIITLVILLINRKRNIYALLVIGSWCVFAWFIPWQPWITRLQLPLFALSAPAFSDAFVNKDKIRKVSVLLLTCFVILPLTINRSRPLFSFPLITSSKTIWNTKRDDLVFNHMSADGSYKHGDDSQIGAYDIIVRERIQNLGIIIGGDSWEYPLWRYIRHNSDKKIRITHVKKDEIDDKIDALFIQDRQTSDIIFIKDAFDINTPLVLIRDEQNKSEWKILYRNPDEQNKSEWKILYRNPQE